jgi:Domain of unknown function (DUF4411)
MQIIDASSMIWAWENYPVGQMVGFWTWFGGEVAAGHIVFPAVALDEVNHKVPDCGTWLVENECTVAPVTNQIVQLANAIKTLLGIANDNYGPKGVDENDLFIIATAQAMRMPLISDEGKQQNPPGNIKNSKIPAVCNHPDVDVECMKFLDYFKASGQVV